MDWKLLEIACMRIELKFKYASSITDFDLDFVQCMLHQIHRFLLFLLNSRIQVSQI